MLNKSKQVALLSLMIVSSFQAHAFPVSPRVLQTVGNYAKGFIASHGKEIINIVLAQGIMTGMQMLYSRGIAIAAGEQSRSAALHNRRPRYANNNEGLIAPGTQAAGQVQGIVDMINNPQRLRRVGGQLWKGILLTGPVGTGKSELGKYIAKNTNAFVVYEAASGINGAAQGSGARSIRELYDRANRLPLKYRMQEKCRKLWSWVRRRPYYRKPIVVVVDEIDAIAGHRDFEAADADQVRATERRAALEQLMTELDGAPQPGIFPEVFLVATTNARAVDLDEGLLRPGRLREIPIGALNEADRLAVLQYHNQRRQYPLDGSVDFEAVARATDGWTGAELAHLLNNSAILLAMQNPQLNPQLAQQQIQGEMRVLNRLRQQRETERQRRAEQRANMNMADHVVERARNMLGRR